MKKVITHSDGSKEEIEGSAEELAEYENKKKNETPKKSGKKILLEDLKRELEEVKQQVAGLQARPYWWYQQPVWIQPIQVLPQQPYNPWHLGHGTIYCGTTTSAELKVGAEEGVSSILDFLTPPPPNADGSQWLPKGCHAGEWVKTNAC